MLFVFSKEKIKSYLVSISTVAILLIASIMIQNNTVNKTIATYSTIKKIPISKVETTEKKVGLSINCIENMKNIDNILSTLSKTKTKATFFITGDLVEKYPEEIKKISNSEQEIGNLSNKYTNMCKLNKEEIEKQIQACNNKIEKITNDVPVLFRAPYGEYNNEIIKTAQDNNMETIQWNIDSLDYNELTTEEICERIQENISNGSIILVHNEYIGESLETIINDIKKSGYKVESVSNILYKNNYEVNENGTQIKVD